MKNRRSNQKSKVVIFYILEVIAICVITYIVSLLTVGILFNIAVVVGIAYHLFSTMPRFFEKLGRKPDKTSVRRYNSK